MSQLHQTEKDPAVWVERLSRLGYATKGLVYGLIGLLALQAAFTTGGKITDASGALETIVQQPFGKVLLAIVALGLLGYTIWQFIRAIKDPEQHGKEPQDIARRLGYAGKGLIYGGLVFSAIRLIVGWQNSGGDSFQEWTARFLSQPFGQWLVGTAGALVLASGVYCFYDAYKASFRKHLKTHEMSETERNWAIRLGRFGIAARGVVFAIIGGLLIQSARLNDASQAASSGEALQVIQNQAFGTILLGIVALGLMAYGVHLGLQAKYRRIDVPS